MSLSEELAAFALEARDIPADVRETSWLHLIDAFGIGLMVSRLDYGASIAAYVDAQAKGSTEATVWGLGRRASRHIAANANGTMTGAINYDDTHNESQLHPGAHLVPLAMALGEVLDLDGPTVVDAIAIGNEVGCRLSCVAPGNFSKRGFHTSSVLGKVYGALMAARLQGLSHAAAVDAAGHAASQAGGLMQCYMDGSWTLAFHHGWTAASALTAAELGAAGFKGPREALEGRLGLFPGFLAQSGVEPAYHRATEGLGTRWENRNMSFKPFMTGCVIHPFIDAALELVREGLDWRQVAKVDMPLAEYLVRVVGEPAAEKKRPSDVFNARVSLVFVIADTLMKGRFDVHSITPEDLRDPALLDLVDRTDYSIDPDPIHPRHFRGWIRVTLRDGRVAEKRYDPWLRMHVGETGTPAYVEQKFLENVTEAAGNRAAAEAVLAAARKLQDGGSIRQFLRTVEEQVP